MISIRRLWRSFASPRASDVELARLHDEIARLRAENRALLNSILGIAGLPAGQAGMNPLPPVPLPNFTTQPATAGHSGPSTPQRAADRPLPTTTSSDPSSQAGPSTAVGREPPQRQSETRNDSSISADAPRMIHTPPHRRRSWHQINRLLEFQSARKDPEKVL